MVCDDDDDGDDGGEVFRKLLWSSCRCYYCCCAHNKDEGRIPCFMCACVRACACSRCDEEETRRWVLCCRRWSLLRKVIIHSRLGRSFSSADILRATHPRIRQRRSSRGVLVCVTCGKWISQTSDFLRINNSGNLTQVCLLLLGTAFQFFAFG